MQCLQLRPHETTVVHALKENNRVTRIGFCNWFLQSVHDGDVDPQLLFFSDESRLSSQGEVNSQNSLYWSAENRGLIQELCLHDNKIGVSCAMSA
jgi:hypothetical protein